MKFINFFNYKLSNLNIRDLVHKIMNEKNDSIKIINCMNPHSFVVSTNDKLFQEALSNSYLNLIDGVGVSTYLSLKKMTRINRITGYDLFEKIQIENCYKHFEQKFLNSLFISSKNINNYAINRSIDNFKNRTDITDPFFLEFGVFDGTSINNFASILKC